MKAISIVLAFMLMACGGNGHESPAAPQLPSPAAVDDSGPMPPRLRIATVYESTPYDDGDLAGGQADGRDKKEACLAAREECKSSVGSCPAERLEMKKCMCWKGGIYDGGYTCTVECSCKAPPEPIS